MSRDQTNFPTVQFQAVEDASSAQRENPVSSNGGRSARANAGYGGLVAGRVGVLPELAARCQVVADDLLLGAVLLLSYGPATHNGKGGPSGTDRATPDFARRVLGPVALKVDAVQAVVALGTEKLRPIAGRRARLPPLLQPRWLRPQYSNAIRGPVRSRRSYP